MDWVSHFEYSEISNTTISVNNFKTCYSPSNTFDISVGIAIRLRNGRSAFRFPAETRNLSLFENVQIGSGAHPTSYLEDTGLSSRQ